MKSIQSNETLENIKQNKGSSNENLSYLSIWHKTSVPRSELSVLSMCRPDDRFVLSHFT